MTNLVNKIIIENFSTFKNKVELNLEKDNRIKIFPNNVFKQGVLKSTLIYGPNNTGKTAIIDAIKAIKNIILNNYENSDSKAIFPNFFSKESTSTLGLEFTINNNKYYYEFNYDLRDNFNYEHFSKIFEDKQETILLKDRKKQKYIVNNDKNLEAAMENSSDDNILIYTINTKKFPLLETIKKNLLEIANKIEILDMSSFNLKKTIDILKNKNEMESEVVKFIKKADIFLDDFYYDESGTVFAEKLLHGERNFKDETIDQLKMVSSYKGVKLPSIFFDSLGTKKITSLASYIIEALEKGKILFIDEFDSSLHFKLTRAILSLFNNDLNKKAQIICTLHDVSLLDCKHLLRKDQIWFTDKDNNGSKLYSLKEFKYSESGIRETTDIIEKYSKGLLGAIPEPDLIEILLEKDDDL